VRRIRSSGSSAGGSGRASARRRRNFALAVTVALIALLGFAVSAVAGPGVTGTNLVTTPDTTPEGYTQPTGYTAPANDGLGVPSGAIKHVWVIIMENHAYESSFTGLNDNTYLAKTLPSDGALLTNYYGTGHSSLDNYTSMVSGQGPVTDDQADCPAYNESTGMSGTGYTDGIVTAGGSLGANPNYGQFASAAGPNAPAGDNGCVYPAAVPTLFNQLDANQTSWKVYAQDLTASDAVGSGAVSGQNAGVQYCGAPDATPGPTPSASQTVAPSTTSPISGSSNAADQYVAKHNPLPWFQSDLSSGDCANGHLATMFGPNDQLYSDLQSESTTPAMNFIPDNCNNAHDSICVGNNLSGGFGGTNDQTPNAPINNVGGSYAGDLMLEHVIPEIMNSPAYSDGGLIAVVFDEAYPQFTYSNDSFANSPVADATAFNSLLNDEAGQTLFGRSLNWEPSGPNVPNVQNQFGQQLSAGPGFNEYLDRPVNAAGANTTTTPPLVGCSTGANYTNAAGVTTPGYYTVPSNECYLGGGQAGAGGEAPSSFTAASGTAGGMITQSVTKLSTSADYALIAPDDEGEQVTAPPTGVTFTQDGGPYNGNVYIGQVVTAPPAAIANPGTDATLADQGSVASFQLVDSSGNPVGLAAASGSYAGTYTLGGKSTGTDPFYDAYDGTTGGGDTGAVLLSPYIKGGTVSNNYYNHYSLLRSLEDFFTTSDGTGTAPGYSGPINVSTGVDGEGHLGYAAQPGLAPFGTDVFTNSPFDKAPGVTTTVTDTSTVTTPGATDTVTTPGSGAGTVTARARTVTVRRTVKVKLTFVPRIIGLSLSEAEQDLHYAALKTAAVKGPNPKTGYRSVVTAVSPSTGTSEKIGHSVTLRVKLVKIAKGR
jgi:hypothetical protein